MELFEGFGKPEGAEIFENKEGISFPSSHLEGMDTGSLEKLSATDAAVEVGKNYYESCAKDFPGVLAGFREAGGQSQEDFSRSYAEYVTNPEKMRTEKPTMYKFMRDEVFFGREFPASKKEKADDAETAKEEKITFEVDDRLNRSREIHFGSSCEEYCQRTESKSSKGNYTRRGH